MDEFHKEDSATARNTIGELINMKKLYIYFFIGYFR